MEKAELTVVTWLWKSTGWRTGYTHEHVNNLQRMVAANLYIPHEFVCITDMPKGIKCRTIPLWHEETSVHTMSPFWPNCYRRLKAFSAEAKSALGERFISMDLDCIVLGDLTPIFARNDDFIILEGEACHYNGSLWMMNTGARKQVWEDFNPHKSPFETMCTLNKNGVRMFGSDQAWISHKLGVGEVVWPLGHESGIYQYSKMLEQSINQIPKDARLVFFAGGIKPWDDNLFAQLQREYDIYKGR